ncbi:TolC family protein [Myxococcaceae bacterium GXIMD 01537]
MKTASKSLPSLLLAAALVPSLAAAQEPAPPASSAPVQVPAPQAEPPAVEIPAGALREVTLKEALALAARQSPDVAAARAQAAVAQASVSRAWSAWRPDISVGGQFVHTSAPAQLDLGMFVGMVGQVYGLQPLPGAGVPPAVDIVAENSRYATLQVSQPLFTPQGVFLIRAARRGSEAADLGAKEAREQVLLGVSRTYLSLQGVQGLTLAAREAEAVALRREREARAQMEAGVAVEVALLRAQSETAQARVQLANLEGQRAQLLALLSALVYEPVRPTALGTGSDVPWGEVREEGAQPWRENYGVRGAAKAVEAAERVVTYDRFQWLPSVAAVGKGNYNSNAGFSGKNLSYDLILAVTVPLYDRGLRYAALDEDKAKLAQARANLESLTARARANWFAARANLEAAKAAQAQAEAQSQLAARAQKQVEAAARQGMATSLELFDADNRSFLANSSAAQARAVVEIRRAELAASEGHLADLVVPPGE